MSVLSTATKAKLGGKAAKTAAKNPGALLMAGKGAAKAARPAAKMGVKLGKPVVKRRASRGVDRMSTAMRSAIEELTTYGPSAAQELGLVEPPKPKRTVPRVAAGVVIGAATMYFLEPEHGKEHREKVASLVG